MSTTTVIAATQAAIADKSRRYHATGTGEVTFMAVGLAGAEEIDIFVGGGSAWVVATDSAGAAIKLTATEPQATLPAGGIIYALDKDATVANTEVLAARNYY